jgi:hypothetical protein
VLTARRPAQFRTDQDPAIRVTQDPATHYHLPHEDTLERHMELADLGGVPFARPEGATVSGTRMAVVHVPRLVTWSDPRFGLRRRYVERWACRARPVEDDELLTGGRVPAVPPAAYALPDGRPARVRDTVLLNLVKLDEPPGGGLWYDVLAVELHPQAGGVLTVRHSRMPLGAGILCSSPIEHAGMANTLYG